MSSSSSIPDLKFVNQWNTDELLSKTTIDNARRIASAIGVSEAKDAAERQMVELFLASSKDFIEGTSRMMDMNEIINANTNLATSMKDQASSLSRAGNQLRNQMLLAEQKYRSAMYDVNRRQFVARALLLFVIVASICFLMVGLAMFGSMSLESMRFWSILLLTLYGIWLLMNIVFNWTRQKKDWNKYEWGQVKTTSNGDLVVEESEKPAVATA